MAILWPGMVKPFKQSFKIPGGAVEIEDRTPRGDPSFRADIVLDDGRTYSTGLSAKEALTSAANWLRHLASKIDEIAKDVP